MPKRALTAAAVDRIKPPASGQVDHFDAGYPGLALRVSYGGRRSWAFFYRTNGKQRRMTLGSYPALGLAAAREAWRDARAAVEAGRDPAGEKAEAKRKEPDTVERVARQFIEKWHRPRNRTADEVARMFELHVYPQIGSREIGSITKRDILDLLDRAIDRGVTVRANRLLANVKVFFGWAVDREIIAASPATGIKAPMPKTDRTRILSDDEVRAFLRACEAMGDPFGPLFRLLLLTGQRRDEVAAAPWAEMDLARALWSLPEARTKNKQPHIVPLSPQALSILDALPSKGRSPLLFPAKFTRASSGTDAVRPVSGFSVAKRQLDRLMLAELGSLPEWRLHDLRRTCVSGMARLGVSAEVREKAVNHVSGALGGLQGVYQHYDFATERREALAAWANHLDRLMTKLPTNVVELRAVP